jgi:hypothetical protein
MQSVAGVLQSKTGALFTVTVVMTITIVGFWQVWRCVPQKRAWAIIAGDTVGDEA